ncbi:MAG: hypothetical protein EOP47_28110 [Sphingobacteriaceae bacterium]|nr:MAG: hypothetical protein EOP47_28110 [Sphingobacteriaceae bacterium]
MYGTFRYFIAITLLCVFQFKTLVNLQRGFNEKKDSVSLIETEESKEEKTEKDNYKEKAKIITYANIINWFPCAAGTDYIKAQSTGLKLPVHFFAVPTPPPWA